MSRRRFYIVGFLVLIAFDALAQISFKMSALQAGPFVPDAAWVMRAALSPWVLGALAGYLGAFFTWMTLLEHAPVGPAFAASHMEVVVIMIVSVPLFDEHLSAPQLAGALLVIAGVLCLACAESGAASGHA